MQIRLLRNSASDWESFVMPLRRCVTAHAQCCWCSLCA